jgi:hypothetical protein
MITTVWGEGQAPVSAAGRRLTDCATASVAPPHPPRCQLD